MGKISDGGHSSLSHSVLWQSSVSPQSDPAQSSISHLSVLCPLPSHSSVFSPQSSVPSSQSLVRSLWSSFFNPHSSVSSPHSSVPLHQSLALSVLNHKIAVITHQFHHETAVTPLVSQTSAVLQTRPDSAASDLIPSGTGPRSIPPSAVRLRPESVQEMKPPHYRARSNCYTTGEGANVLFCCLEIRR